MTQVEAAVFLLHLVVTIGLTGIAWFLQLVHYPLFARTGRMRFARYHQGSVLLASFVITPLMVVELVSGLLLFFLTREDMSRSLQLAGLAFLAVVSMVTLLAIRPAQRVLSGGFQPGALRRILRWNCLRTAGWSFRTVILVMLLALVFRDRLLPWVTP